LLALVVACTACVATQGGSSSGTFPMTVQGDSGVLRLVLDASPSPPVVGTNTIAFTISRASDGAPQDGLSVSVVPWMPAMGHGTSSPTVTPRGNGKYEVSELYFFMPGEWELKTTIAGSVADHAEPTFEVQ
jgi:hypothetical protein